MARKGALLPWKCLYLLEDLPTLLVEKCVFVNFEIATPPTQPWMGGVLMWFWKWQWDVRSGALDSSDVHVLQPDYCMPFHHIHS